jgi:hypothetical protein
MKYMMVGLILFLLVTSSWAGTFMDDFEDGWLDSYFFWSQWRLEDREWRAYFSILYCYSKSRFGCLAINPEFWQIRLPVISK